MVSQAERLYWLDAQIRAGNYPNVSKLQNQFEVSKRTAHYDATFLRDRLGAPLVYDRRRSGWRYDAPHYEIPFLALSDQEADLSGRKALGAVILSPASVTRVIFPIPAANGSGLAR